MKKVPRIFRLKPETDGRLREKSRIIGVNQTTILERALEWYLEGQIHHDAVETANKLKRSFVAADSANCQLVAA